MSRRLPTLRASQLFRTPTKIAVKPPRVATKHLSGEGVTQDEWLQYLQPDASMSKGPTPPPSRPLKPAPLRIPSLLVPIKRRMEFIWKKYTKVKPLGAGAYGEAFEVRRKQDRQTQILKVMKTSSLVSLEKLRLIFNQETTVLRHMTQPQFHCQEHMICLEDMEFNENQQVGYFTMRKVKGYEMYDYSEKHPFLPGEKLLLIKDMLEGLIQMHANGVIHRDIKMENMLVSPNLKTWFIDFGLSCLTTDSKWKDCLSRTAGTPQFFSPELARGQFPSGGAPLSAFANFGKAADIWALGVTIFALVFQSDLGLMMQQFMRNPHVDQTHLTPDLLKQTLVLMWKLEEKDAKVPYPSDVKNMISGIITALLTFNPTKRLSAPQHLLHLFNTRFMQDIHKMNQEKVYVKKRKERMKSVHNVREWPQMFPRPRARLGTMVPFRRTGLTFKEKRQTAATMEDLKKQHRRGAWQMFHKPPGRIRFMGRQIVQGKTPVESFAVRGKHVFRNAKLLTDEEIHEVMQQMRRERWKKGY